MGAKYDWIEFHVKHLPKWLRSTGVFQTKSLNKRLDVFNVNERGTLELVITQPDKLFGERRGDKKRYIFNGTLIAYALVNNKALVELECTFEDGILKQLKEVPKDEKNDVFDFS